MQPVTSLQLVGLPVRITLNGEEPAARNSPPLRLHGSVGQISGGRLQLDLVEPFPFQVETSGLTVEILHPEGLLLFQTSGPAQGAAGALRLALPVPADGELQWMQRRRHVRADVQFTCRLITGNREIHRVYVGVTHNISAGGIAVDVEAELEVGERVAVELAPTPGLPAEPLLAEVVRVTPRGAETIWGLRFTDLPPGVEALIDQFVINMHQQAHH